ncbi:hypothetical protein C2G38_2216770 [Gigaspora rosea]|uniref:Uncharacterized protein n=1 Tax=Gigaspora rosea TaxID=44941 RepID=A0A397UCT5_9GLOM|nr:hypothetical protein C2G38_2216770 [Gigaspora rosea]
MPNRDFDKKYCIIRISNFHEWAWSVDDEGIGSIRARALPGIGNWKLWSSTQIEKIVKKRKLEKPNPICTSHSYSCKAWVTPIVDRQKIQQHLERLFHIGTANLRQKMTAEQMHIELKTLAQEGIVPLSDIPKVSSIRNWISGFSQRWKEAMALRSLEENLSENF